MAHCSVLEAHQKPTDKPTRRIKRSGGQSLVRQGLARWITENILLQLVIVGKYCSLREITPQYRGPAVYQHHIEPKLHKVNRREMEELERWYATFCGDGSLGNYILKSLGITK